MPYTKESVNELVDLYMKLDKAEEALESFCTDVAKRLGWDSVEGIRVVDGMVCFMAHWYGPYQAHNSQEYNFPVSMLTEGESAVYEFLTFKHMNAERQKTAKKEISNETVPCS